MADTPIPSQEPRTGRKRKSWRWLLIPAVLIAIGVGIYWWLSHRNQVSTDDAYAVADNARISSRVPGTIIEVAVHNDQSVKVGDVLVKLDPSDYRLDVARQEAVVERLQADVKAAQIGISQVDAQTAAQVASAKSALQAAQDRERSAEESLKELQNRRGGVAADYNYAQWNYERYQALVKQGAVSERQLEQTATAAKKAKSAVDAIDSQIASASSTVEAAQKQVAQASAQLDVAQSTRDKVDIQIQQLASKKASLTEAKANLETARLKLSYTTVPAPITGYVAQKSIQVGDRIQPGQALMSVVPLEEIYAEANFKETQLENIRIGQPATIEADVYPGYTYHGTVAGVRAGTGAAFSLLPPENATGNWIKVVQRVPVKVILNSPPPPQYPLRVGLSLTVTVHTQNKTGSSLRPYGTTTGSTSSQ